MVHGAALSFNPDPALNLFFAAFPKKYWIKFLFYTSTFILTGRLCPVYKLIIGMRSIIQVLFPCHNGIITQAFQASIIPLTTD